MKTTLSSLIVLVVHCVAIGIFCICQSLKRGLILWFMSFCLMAPTFAQTDDQGIALGPGYGPLKYALPAPGSYQLAKLDEAPDGGVLDSSGEARTLHDLFDNRITLLSFMYSSCSDVNGCPLSAYVFHQIKTAMQKDAQLAERLQLISMSFDPAYDTPEKMKLYEANYRYAGPAGDWRFVTTPSEAHLAPILAAYGQDVERIVGATPDQVTEISHLLRVYLVDENRQIRNIYSVAFLHADVLLTDVKTLLADGTVTASDTGVKKTAGPKLSRPGDGKSGYTAPNYVTDSLALTQRVGRPTDLLNQTLSPPLGLPSVPVPAHNPLTAEKIALGRKLFFDRRLSINDTFSCAMCHVPEQGFTSNELATAVGVEGRTVRRNSLTLYNIAYAPRLFHDGREENLEQQVWAPLLARNEMANPSIGYVLQKIRSLPDYDGLFEQAFDDRPVSMETISQAFASYERTLVSANSAFDRWYYGRQPDAMNAVAQRGFELFKGKAGCVACHVVGKDSALFSDYQLHNTGLGYAVSLGIDLDQNEKSSTKRVTLAPGVFVDVDKDVIASVGELPPSDVGLYEITEDPADRWKFRTPTLRNVALTAPYMHNGQLSTLKEVVEFYNRGGIENDLLDPRIAPLNLTAQERYELVAFMLALTGDNVDKIVSDAFAAPVGDVGQVRARRTSP